MCGFVALLESHRGIDKSIIVENMLNCIVHRGPDDSGVVIDGPVALGFRRLSILDLSSQGHQPMNFQDGQLTIVFNGEIFNFLELRVDLEKLGHQFRSNGDTEVLLAAYRQWGAACLQRLNGMWAFVILDRARNVLFGSRDRFGIKPLFRWQEGSCTYLSSEIKAIRGSGRYRNGFDLPTVASFLYDGLIDTTNHTFHDGILQVPAGHAFELTLDGQYREWRWWDVLSSHSTAVDDPPQAFADLFEDAMRIHMRSDVPVGVNLSGGLDSTAIICAAARIRAATGADTPLLAFCYQDSKFDETGYISDTLALTRAQLVPLEMTPQQLWTSLPNVLAQQDEPVHSMTAVVGYQLMALAARHGVKVILNGQGADEVIGGYGSYFKDYWSELLIGGQFNQAWEEISAYSALHGGNARLRFRQVFMHVVRYTSGRLGPYRTASEWKRRKQLRKVKWLRAELAEYLPLKHGQPIAFREILSESITTTPLPLYLRVEDRNSMAHSIEVRLPFLDHRLVSLVFGMDSRQKICGPWNKQVLREAMRGRIPESVRARVDKMGFPTDMASWFRNELYEPLREVFHDRDFEQIPLFNAKELQDDLVAHRAGQKQCAAQLFSAAQFFLWQKSLA